MRALIVDASVAVKWLVPEDGSPAAQVLRQKDLQLYAPDFLLTECASAICKKVQRRQLDERQATEILSSLKILPIELLPARNLLEGAFVLAVILKQSVYDCLYLALAIALETRLVTADKRFYDVIAATTLDTYIEFLEKQSR